MITDLTLRWVVTLLFAVSVVECSYSLARHSYSTKSVVGHLLHLIMSVAMIVMAWPFGMGVPNVPPMIFFVAAALWYLGVVTLTKLGRRTPLLGLYHATMMGAMAWMYAVMDGTLLPGTTPMSSMAMPMSGDDHMSMAGMDMSSHDPHDMSSTGWVSAVDTAIVLGFGIATLWWLYRYLVARQKDSRANSLLQHAGTLCQAFMAAGMAIMFSVM